MPETLLTIPVLRPTLGAFNGVGYAPGAAAPSPGSPYLALHYRTADKTITDDSSPAGKVVIDRRQRLNFQDPLADVQVNDTPPVPSGLKITCLNASLVPGTAVMVPVSSAANLIAGQWVFIGTDDAQEAVQVITAGSGFFTANVTNEHCEGETIYSAVLSRVIRVRAYGESKQCDLEVGTI